MPGKLIGNWQRIHRLFCGTTRCPFALVSSSFVPSSKWETTNIVPLLTLSTTKLYAVSKCLWPQKYTEGCLMRKDSWAPLENIVWRGFHCIAVADQGNVANRKVSILTYAIRMETLSSNSSWWTYATYKRKRSLSQTVEKRWKKTRSNPSTPLILFAVG